MKKFITLAFQLISIACAAQTRMNVYFLKNDGHYVNNRDSADFIRIVSEPDSGSKLYNVSEYYLNNKRKSVGKSSKIDPPYYEGSRLQFYNSGLKKSVSNYKDGTLVDDEIKFYPNGKPYLIIKHTLGSATEDSFDENYPIIANYDSTGVALVTDGNGSYRIYDNQFKYLEETGIVKNGKKQGLVTGSDNKGKWHFQEQYENGELISGTMTDDTGFVTHYVKSRNSMPHYKGDLKAFYQYLGNKINYPDAEKNSLVQGIVVIGFVVEKNGKLSELKVLHPVSPGIDAEALRVMKNSPLWIPGTRFGRVVRVQYQIPINFSLTEN